VAIGAFMILNRYAVENLASAALRAPGAKDDALMDLVSFNSSFDKK
jgi:hypothetical protein